MKIAAGIIVFNSDFVLRQVLESIYPHVDQILIAEGPVKYWASRGFSKSTDRTLETIKNFQDPEHKISLVQAPLAGWEEKTDQANAYMKYLNPDIDYIWNIDADEVFKEHDIIRIKQLLEQGQYTSAGFHSITFFGGFDHHITGFEWEHEFMRIRKVYPGSLWKDHRPPTIEHAPGITPLPEKHLDYNTLASEGIFMYHYSYVFPRQVQEKVQYYENAIISPGNCIPQYFNELWLPWVTTPDSRPLIERKYQGVHEFVPSYRGAAFSRAFRGSHPKAIQEALPQLTQELARQLLSVKS